MTIKKGFKFDTSTEDIHQVTAEEIAREFESYMNEFHSFRNPFDTDLDLYLHSSYAAVLRRNERPQFDDKPYFSPSSAGSDSRELYEKVRGSQRDESITFPYQTMWQAIGTAIGDAFQRQVLLGERHYEAFTGKTPRFAMERNDLREPMFEEFARTQRLIRHKGKEFWLFGTTDGILQYQSADGEILRVGLEIKSKQTSYSATTHHSLKEASSKHVDQCGVYSMMYGVDYWLIVYINAAKKGWNMTLEDQAKYPHMRVFGVYITKEMKRALLDKFADVLIAAENGTPPKLDLNNFTFNNFKTACAVGLTDKEFLELIDEAERIESANLPEYKKKPSREAIQFIAAARGL
jgi:hypothetical protein